MEDKLFKIQSQFAKMVFHRGLVYTENVPKAATLCT